MKLRLKTLTLVVALIALASFFSPPSFAADSTIVKKDSVTVTLAPTVTSDSVVVKTSDSTAQKVPTSTITAPSTITFLGIKLPAWVGTMIFAFITIIPGIQLVLKKIPSATPIGGIIGTILNILTFFQKNISTSPPSSNTTT